MREHSQPTDNNSVANYKSLLEMRRQKAMEIVKSHKLTYLGDKWLVPSQTGNGSSTWHKMWYYFMYKHGEFTEHYHKRSNAETVFHMIKSKFGDSIRSKTETAQINEVLLKVLCHNICCIIQEMHELGISADFFVEKV